MEWGRVKNIIILVLLMVNGFLLVLVGARRGEVLRYEQAAMNQAVQVLEENGIRMSVDGVTPAEQLAAQTVERSISAEEALACALLNETVVAQNQGGGLYFYEGKRGTVSFRAGGEMAAVLDADPRWHGNNPTAHATQLLSDMQLRAELVETDMTDGSGTVTFRQLWGDVPLFPCRVTFIYKNGELVTIGGTLLPGEGGAAESGALLDIPTALLRFLDEILASGDVCSEVVSMEPGYRMTQSFSSSLRLNPVWLISSNTAEYYMDAATGELSRLTG